MANFWTVLLILSIFTGSQCVSGQSSDSITAIQAYWNELCADGSTAQGCGTGAISSSNTGVSSTVQPIRDFIHNRPSTTPPSRVPSLSTPSSLQSPSSSVGCPPNKKRCPQLPSNCISKFFDCSLLPSNHGCSNDEKRCPQMMTRCIPNHVDCNVFYSDISCRTSGATGVECDDNTSVVVRPGCGRVRHTSENAPIHRVWPWMRAIYKGGQLHCTATLVSSSAVVTAAHCLTRSLLSNEPDPNSSIYELELTGPDFNTPRIKLKAESLHIHPRYNFNNNNLQYDVGVIFFNFQDNYELPIACIADQPYILPQGRKQMVFSLLQDNGLQTEDGGQIIPASDIRVVGFSTNLPSPSWNSAEASWDFTCKTTSDRHNAGCVDQVQVERSQFCATHEGLSMRGGSSGGPYLVEVGEGVEDMWVLMGVLSSFRNDSSCKQDHSIYSPVADETKWVKRCVFERNC